MEVNLSYVSSLSLGTSKLLSEKLCAGKSGALQDAGISSRMVLFTKSWATSSQNTSQKSCSPTNTDFRFQYYAKGNTNGIKIQGNCIQWYFTVQFNLLFSLVNKPDDISIMQNEKLQ